MEAKTTVVLITGGNKGLGLEMVRALFHTPTHPPTFPSYEILLCARSLSAASAAAQEFKSAGDEGVGNQVWPLEVDIESDASIQRLEEEVQGRWGRVDVLVNNAGAQFDQQHASGALTMREMWLRSWNVNTVGTQILTHTFVPLLLKSKDPRLVFLTSGTSTLQGTEERGLMVNKVPERGWPKKGGFAIPAYRASKCGLNMMMREWYRMLKEDGVKVWAISPGFLATGLGGTAEMNRSLGAGDPAVAGEFVKDVVEGKRDEDVGKVIVRGGVQPW